MAASTPFSLRDQWFFVLAQVGATIWALGWLFGTTPSPGYSIGVLAVVAAVMSVHPEMKDFQKVIWMLLIGAFLTIEFRAIDKDRKENNKQQAATEQQQQQAFQSILDSGTQNFKDLLSQEQAHFEKTIGLFLKAQRDERKAFSGVLEQQQALFRHQEEVAESLNGTLVPGSEPTPSNRCTGQVPDNAVVTIIGSSGGASYTSTFPHTIIRSRSHGNVLGISKSSDGSLKLNLDVRSGDGKIIVRMNESGFVLNHNNFLDVRKDKSSLLVEDEYGSQVINLRYLNPKAILVTGRGIEFPPGISACFGNNGTDLIID
jgi:hypothetical protein